MWYWDNKVVGHCVFSMCVNATKMWDPMSKGGVWLQMLLILIFWWLRVIILNRNWNENMMCGMCAGKEREGANMMCRLHFRLIYVDDSCWFWIVGSWRDPWSSHGEHVCEFIETSRQRDLGQAHGGAGAMSGIASAPPRAWPRSCGHIFLLLSLSSIMPGWFLHRRC